jgi:hypothetical protein
MQTKAYKVTQSSNQIALYGENDFTRNGMMGKLCLQNSLEFLVQDSEIHVILRVRTHIGRYIGRNQWLMPLYRFDARCRKLNPIE